MHGTSPVSGEGSNLAPSPLAGKGWGGGRSGQSATVRDRAGSPQLRRSSRSILWPVLGLIAALALAFGRLVVQPGGLIADPDRASLDHASPPEARAPGNDLTRVVLPRFLWLTRAIGRDGRVPTWDPSGFGGRPLVGNPQAGLFYPPSWLTWSVGNPATPGWITVGHLLWAGIGMVLLVRRMGLEVYASYVAFVGFCLSPYVVTHLVEGHYPHLWAVCWFPWAFRAGLGVWQGAWRWALAVPPMLAAAFLTGHPQEAYYLAIALGAWWAIGTWRVSRTGGFASLGTSVGFAVVLVALTAGLLAIEWLPDRAVAGWTLKGRPPSVSSASHYALDWPNLAQLLSPQALGGPSNYFGAVNRWESLLSFGGVTTALAVVGVARSRRSDAVRGLGLLVLIATAFAAGKGFGVFDVLYRIVPGMAHFRAPARALFLSSLGIAILAGLGVEAIATRGDGWASLSQRWNLATTALVVGIGLGAIAAKINGSTLLDPVALHENPTARLARAALNIATDPIALAALLVPAIGIHRLARRPNERRRIANGLGFAAVAELVLRAWLVIPVSAPADWMAPDALADAIASSGPPAEAPIRARDVDLDDLRAAAWEIEKTNVGDAFQIQHAAELAMTLYPIFDPPRPADLFDPIGGWQRARTRQAVLDRMGVARLVSDQDWPADCGPIVAEGLRDGQRFRVYANPTALPRAYLVPRAFVWPDQKSVVDLLADVPATESALMAVDPLADRPGNETRQAFTPLSFERPTADTIAVEFQTGAPGLLVIAETWMPGWSARLDGRSAPIWRANRAQMVVAIVENGPHRLALRYDPPGLFAGAILTGSTALVWLVFVGLALPRECVECGHRR